VKHFTGQIQTRLFPPWTGLHFAMISFFGFVQHIALLPAVGMSIAYKGIS